VELATIWPKLAIWRKSSDWTSPQGKLSGAPKASRFGGDIAAAYARAEEQQKRSAALVSEIDGLKKELEIVRAESERLKQSGSGSTNGQNSSDSERKLQEALQSLEAAKRERESLKEEIAGLNQGLDRAKQHIGSMQGRRDQMRADIAKLKVKLGLAPDAAV
jgi:chromosome segregation ATPase